MPPIKPVSLEYYPGADVVNSTATDGLPSCFDAIGLQPCYDSGSDPLSAEIGMYSYPDIIILPFRMNTRQEPAAGILVLPIKPL